MFFKDEKTAPFLMKFLFAMVNLLIKNVTAVAGFVSYPLDTVRRRMMM